MVDEDGYTNILSTKKGTNLFAYVRDYLYT